ncbi:hypothetical protein K493DRAFT_403718 [Basidiobolus meristosporus CBS 931.73]|uniref:Uncharacterized protein n=1 Tax=Basidiobolus meristosporus CBS 931.73 TaxID=1314790 RepID=A0A1Y1ZAZ9_9FUNG|nr:hypothetical protein K493DRAFT_403718 [Basidiobolus meristosporus CBS 931.73]|eukprot:ORY07493.1 hypothetical protein K493DRAFT_403718 [Basidiobolus meristosporus CBS 931.73]
MSAPLLRAPNRTHFTTGDGARYSAYSQFPAGVQLDPSSDANSLQEKQASAEYPLSQENIQKKPLIAPDSPLSQLLPPTSARLTAMTKQPLGTNSSKNGLGENHRMRGGSFSERTLPSLERMRERKDAFGHPVLRKQLSSSTLQQDSLHSKIQPKISAIISSTENLAAQNKGASPTSQRISRSRGYSLSELSQRESLRQTFNNLPPPPFPPPGLSPNVILSPEQEKGSTENTLSKSTARPKQKPDVQTHQSAGTYRDSKVDADLDDDHLEYYLAPEKSQSTPDLQETKLQVQPACIDNEDFNGLGSLLPLRSSSLPRKVGGMSTVHRPSPLDFSKIKADIDAPLGSSQEHKVPKNLVPDSSLELPKSATFKPPTPKFPPPEAIRPSDSNSTSKETNMDADTQGTLLSSAKAAFNREPPPPLSVITYRPGATPPTSTTPVLRDRPGANGGSIQLTSMAALKAESAQKQKGALAADYLASRSSVLAPNFRRKMSLPMGLGTNNMMKSAVQNSNSSLMPKSYNNSQTALSSDPSPTGLYFTNSNRRPYKGLTLFDIVLEEPQEGASLLEGPPPRPELQPFWLMRCFERSMVNGGFISAKMYIPRSLWYQSGARLSAIEAKISACELITATLYNMVIALGQQIPTLTTVPPVTSMKETEISMMLKELESFETVLFSVQNNLAKKLSFIESIKKSQSSFLSLGNRITKSLERMTTSRDKIDDVSLYIDVLIKLFQTCQVVDRWIRQFHQMPPGELQSLVLSRLIRVSEFMNNVVCAFVMRDLTVLMAKYLKRCKEWLID